jgi:hypothetical protein
VERAGAGRSLEVTLAFLGLTQHRRAVAQGADASAPVINVDI